MKGLFLPWKAVGEFAIIDCRDFRVAQCVEKGINTTVVDVVNAAGLKQLVAHPKRGPRKQSPCQVLPKSLEHLVCLDLQDSPKQEACQTQMNCSMQRPCQVVPLSSVRVKPNTKSKSQC